MVTFRATIMPYKAESCKAPPEFPTSALPWTPSADHFFRGRNMILLILTRGHVCHNLKIGFYPKKRNMGERDYPVYK